MTFPIAGAKTICFPVDSEAQYATLVCDPLQFRTYLDQLIEQNPELFPPEIEAGYWWHGMIHSKKQQLLLRRIKVLATGEVYQL